MVLTRWDPTAPLSPHNLVLVQQTVLPFVESLHDKNTSLPDSPLTPEVVTRINDRLRWAREICENDWPPQGLPERQPKSPIASAVMNLCGWVTAYRGPLLLLPSTLALIALTFRANKR